jgi:hypothetical protein
MPAVNPFAAGSVPLARFLSSGGGFRLSALIARVDRVDHLPHTRGLQSNRLCEIAFRVSIDLTRQIHHVIQSLHVQEIRRLQRGVSIEQRADLGRDFRIAGTTGEPTFPVYRAPVKASGRNGG